VTLHEMFVDLQMEGSISSILLQVIIEITDDAKNKDYFCGSFTECVVCAGTPTGSKGPCEVRGL